MSRRSFTTKQRVAFFTLHKGICHLCGGAIQPGQNWEVEHVIALALGGADEPENWRPAHKKCHAVKTATGDVPAIAKAKRREAKHIGASSPSKVSIQSRGFEKKPRIPKLPVAGVSELQRRYGG